MKKLLKLTLVAALALTFSCGEDYLEKVPSEFISTDQIADAASRNPDVIAGTMTGIYALQFDSGTGGTTNHDDYGQKGYDVFTDMLCGDVALTVSTYGWYRSDITEFQATQDFTRIRNYMPWRYYYRLIRSANTVIDALGGNDAVPELEANKYIMGQAKAIRGHSYFYLTQLFQKEYNPSEEILPIYDDLLDQNGPKVPASEIFDFIQNDLNDAITLLDGFSRSGKQEINQDVAKGILAYVYAAIGNNAGAQELTKQVIENGAFPIMSGSEVLGGFNDVSTPGWMWGVDLTSDTGVSLISWWGQMDYYSYSYAAYGDYKACDADLFAAIPANDVRKGQFLDLPSNSRHLQPLYKFYEAQRQPFGSSQIIQSDYVYMRISEMYLLHCEAAAKAGDEGRARTVLKLFLAERLDDTSYVDGLSGQALLDEIYLQTRIEFWGEGKTYLAMKRGKRSATRGPNHLSFVGETIQYNDERLTFEIPEAEILNNPFISDQNQ
jgi:hypothetical protein